jgi:hypothetical protein
MKDNQPVPDAKQVYRFEQRGVLRLLFGTPPLPGTRTVALHLAPWAVSVGHGSSHETLAVLPLPVEEYNPYFAPSAQRETRLVSRLDLVVQFVMETEGLRATPLPWAKNRVQVPAPVIKAAGVGAYLRASAPLTGVSAVCEGKGFARLRLPGDALPPGAERPT